MSTPASARLAQLDTLTNINLDDFMESLGLANLRRGRGLLRWLFRLPARQFAQAMVRFDAEVGENGLAAAGAWLIKRHVKRLEVAGQENVPAVGPVLLLSNHPGLTDTVALFATLPRADLRALALVRPFLNALPNTSLQLLYLSDDEAERLPTVRAAVNTLRAGGALLTFPAGEIEPDPYAHGAASAIASLQRWSPSIELFARRVPQTRIVPVIVSGVVSPGALHNPLTRVRRAPKDRERMAAMLQVVFPMYRGVIVRVAYGVPLECAALIATRAPVARAVADGARRLIESPPIDWRTVVMAGAAP